MNTPTTLGGFGLVLVVAFAAAAGVGTAVGPVSATTPTAPASAQSGHTSAGMSGMNDTAPHTSGDTPAMPGMSHGDSAPQGLAVAAEGYTLHPTTTTVPSGPFPFTFQILGPDGAPLTGYTAEHERELHFIVVRRDLSGYQHLHPTRGAEGTWIVPLTVADAGVYKAFADFQPAGAAMPLTLGVDLFVPGDFRPTPLPAPAPAVSVDGYTVTLTGALRAGQASDLSFTVSQDGSPVTDLQPYLGAYGHLVALRVGDLAYSHVHPEGAPGDGHTPPGPQVGFHAELPTAGAYRLFLDFQTGGVVHTAAFTTTAGA